MVTVAAGDTPMKSKDLDDSDVDSLPELTIGAPPGATRKGDILILDWDGPEDPGNPKKYVVNTYFAPTMFRLLL